MIQELLEDAELRMDQAIEYMASEFGTVRTGRANPQILHRIHVEYYGTKTPLQQLATFSVPEPRLLVIQPFDKSSIGDIERAILESDLGLSPANDGIVIRLAFPTLTEERRKDLIKVVRHQAEEGRIAIRHVRQNVKKDMEDLHGEISDDDIIRGEKSLQELTDRHTKRVDAMLAEKEKELLEV